MKRAITDASPITVELVSSSRKTKERIEFDVCPLQANGSGDICDYVVRFHRTSYKLATRYHLATLRLLVTTTSNGGVDCAKGRRSDSGDSSVILNVPLYDIAEMPYEATSLLDMEYVAFETHAISFVENSDEARAIYFQVCTAYVTGSKPHPQLTIDMGMWWFVNQFPDRFTPIQFFPSDVNPINYGLHIDASKIPPRSPLWFSFRGPVTGRKASTLLGFYVPKTGNWSIDAEAVFSDKTKELMWFGTDSEDVALVILLHAYPNIKVRKTNVHYSYRRCSIFVSYLFNLHFVFVHSSFLLRFLFVHSSFRLCSLFVYSSFPLCSFFISSLFILGFPRRLVFRSKTISHGLGIKSRWIAIR